MIYLAILALAVVAIWIIDWGLTGPNAQMREPMVPWEPDDE